MKSLKRTICLSVVVVSQSFSQTTPAASPYLKHAEVSETQGTVHVLANNPRPLAQTLDALREKYGWVVNYEDPRFLSKLDVTEAASPMPGGSKAQLFPGGGRFGAEFPVGSAASTPPASEQASSAEEEKAVQLIVDSYNRSDNPGRFELRKTGQQGSLSVVGTAAHDVKGRILPQKPVLDSPVTLLRKERTATATIQLLCEKLTALSGTNVALGVTPRNLLDHNTVTVGGGKASARDLLLQILTLTHGNCYWRLFFDPNSKGYLLSIHQVLAPKDPVKDPVKDPAKSPAKGPA